jgi:hypothetical protein
MASMLRFCYIYIAVAAFFVWLVFRGLVALGEAIEWWML